MSTAIGTRTFGGWKRYTEQHLRVALAGAIALAAVAGVGAWQAMDSGSNAVTSTPRRAFTNLAKDEPNLTYLIVGSEAQAERVLLGEADAAAIRAPNGDKSTGEKVEVLVAPAGDANRIPAIIDLNNTRAALGLPEAQVKDLRGF